MMSLNTMRMSVSGNKFVSLLTRNIPWSKRIMKRAYEVTTRKHSSRMRSPYVLQWPPPDFAPRGPRCDVQVGHQMQGAG